jgi:hypothetical protein
MALFDYTMAPELIKGWVKKMRPHMECERAEIKKFQNELYDVQLRAL